MNRARPLSRTRFVPRHRGAPRLAPLALLSALTLASACNGDSSEQTEPKTEPEADAVDKRVVAEPAPPLPTKAPANTVDSAPIAERGEVVATAQFPSGTQLTDITAVLETIQPSIAPLVAQQLPALLGQTAGFDLADAKLDAPISIVALNPSEHEQPVAILLEAKDSAALIAKAKAAGHEALERDGRLLVGPKTVVAAAKDFAFTHLTKYPNHSEIILYPALVVDAFAAQIEQFLAGMGASMAMLKTSTAAKESTAKMLRDYADGLLSLARQTDRIVFSVSAAPDSADLITRIYPVDGSVFASFVGAQVPTDHALLGELPAAADGMRIMMSGELRTGGARDALMEFGTGFLGRMFTGLPAEDWSGIMNRWLDNLDGRFAASVTLNIVTPQAPGVQMHYLMGATDSDALRKVWREMLELMVARPTKDMMGMKLEIGYEKAALVHDGVPVDLYTTNFEPSTTNPATQPAMTAATQRLNSKIHLAAFDKLAVMAMANADSDSIKSIIDASRGRGEVFTPSANYQAALSESKARSDSALVYFDVSKFPAAVKLPFRAFATSIGKDGEALRLRISLRK